MAETPKAAPARPRRDPAPAAAEPVAETAPAPKAIAGIAIFGSTAVQDPVQAAMDAAVAEHNAAELKRLAGEG